MATVCKTRKNRIFDAVAPISTEQFTGHRAFSQSHNHLAPVQCHINPTASAFFTLTALRQSQYGSRTTLKKARKTRCINPRTAQEQQKYTHFKSAI
jgi:hypothetical protein